jgi:hypothetical protein
VSVSLILDSAVDLLRSKINLKGANIAWSPYVSRPALVAASTLALREGVEGLTTAGLPPQRAKIGLVGDPGLETSAKNISDLYFILLACKADEALSMRFGPPDATYLTLLSVRSKSKCPVFLAREMSGFKVMRQSQ